MSVDIEALAFKEIPGHAGYAATKCGKIISLKGWLAHPGPRILSDLDNGYGYRIVRLGQKRTKYFVHRLVLLSFVGECPIGMETRHLNGIRSDNRLENLTYGTRSQNAADRTVHGHCRAAQNGRQYAYKLMREYRDSITKGEA